MRCVAEKLLATVPTVTGRVATADFGKGVFKLQILLE